MKSPAAEIYRKLKYELASEGARSAMVRAERIPELRTELLSMHADGLIDPGVHDRYVENYFDFSVLSEHPEIRSLVIVATPSPRIDATFHSPAGKRVLPFPPTYADRKKVTGWIRSLTSRLFESIGFKTFPVVLPKKLMAAKCGMGRFGKNNLCYFPGTGSYCRLTVFATDIPCIDEHWQDVQMLDRCRNCDACLRNCPPGAIVEDRFVVAAERCLTWFNEQKEPIPRWIDPSWHNSVIGCMRCQEVCPENRKIRSDKSLNIEFSEQETVLVTQGVAFDRLPANLQRKLSSLCMDVYYVQFSRNLRMLIDHAVMN